jgi:hypothetical protein
MTEQIVLLVLLTLVGLWVSRRNRENRKKEAFQTGGVILATAALLCLVILAMARWIPKHGPADAAQAPTVNWQDVQWNWERDTQPTLLRPKDHHVSNELLLSLYDKLDGLWRTGQRSKGLDLARMILNIAPNDPVATAAIEVIEQAVYTQQARANLTHIPPEYQAQLLKMLAGTRYRIIRIQHDDQLGRQYDKITLQQVSPGWLYASEIVLLRSQLETLGTTTLGDTFTFESAQVPMALQ